MEWTHKAPWRANTLGPIALIYDAEDSVFLQNGVDDDAYSMLSDEEVTAVSAPT
jgi:hypothetical protein